MSEPLKTSSRKDAGWAVNMFNLQIITYKGMYRDADCDSVNLPTPDGRRGVLPNHMPIMIPVDIGVMHIVEKGVRKRYAVSEGIFYFENNKATMLVDSVEDVSIIDVERARRAKERAEERLRVAQSESDILRAQIALKKAINRIRAIDDD